MRIPYLTLLFCMCWLTCFGQELTYLGRPESETLPDHYRFDPNQLRERIYAKLPAPLKEDVKTDRRCLMFSQEYATAVSALISSGTLYNDWPELESYLNQILDRILPEPLKGDTMIHVYVARDGDNNAYMLPSGQIILNVGFLAEAPSEDLIAVVLLHELAHFYKSHMIYSYMESLKSPWGQKYYYYTRKFQRNSIEFEKEADQLALNWTLGSGYSLNGMKYHFQADSLADANRVLRSKHLWKITETTHPLSKSRLKAVTDFINMHPEPGSADFLVSQELFMKYRAEARIEALKYLLQSMNYYQCIERAFKYHIYEPGNPGNIYFLLEAIRRQCYHNRGIWLENFITNRFYVPDPPQSTKNKKHYDSHLFQVFDPGVLGITPNDTGLIRTRRYWNGPPDFKTYEEAFVYFYNLGRLQKMHEILLTNALSVNHIPESRNKLLSEYLSYDDIRHREFANALLTDSLYLKLDTARMLVLMEFNTYYNILGEHLLIIPQAIDTSDHIRDILKGIEAGTPGIKTYTIQDIAGKSTINSRMLMNLHQYSQWPTVSVGEKVQMALIDPFIWEHFRSFGVNRVIFLSADYAIPSLVNRSVPGYQLLINGGTNPMYYPPKRKRYMELELNAINMSPEGQMKKKYFYYTHFGNMKISVPEISNDLSERIKDMDKQKVGDFYLRF